MLECHGVIQRSRQDGDRRDHFEIRHDAADALIERSQQRALNNIQSLRAFKTNTNLTDEQVSRIDGMEHFIGASMQASASLIDTLHNQEKES